MCNGLGEGEGEGAGGSYGCRPSSAASLVILEDSSGRPVCKAIRPYLPGEAKFVDAREEENAFLPVLFFVIYKDKGWGM